MQIIPQTGGWYWQHFLSVHCCIIFLLPSNVNKTQVVAVLLVFNFSPDRLDPGKLSTSNVSNMILRSDVKHTGSQCSWNKTDVINTPFYECTSPDVQHSSALPVAGLSERQSGIFYNNALHCPVKTLCGGWG